MKLLGDTSLVPTEKVVLLPPGGTGNLGLENKLAIGLQRKITVLPGGQGDQLAGVVGSFLQSQ